MLKKIVSLALGLLFTFVLVESSLRIIGFIANRESQQEETKKKSKEFTILTLGNSYTAGSGAPKGKSYPDYLRRYLNQERDKSYKVINHGKPSVNTTYILENLPSWLEASKPNLVFIMTGEPNGWNKYGFIDFVKNKRSIVATEIILDKLRFFKTFRLIELMLNRNESFKSFFYNYSNTFSHIKKSEVKLLGYTWLGQIQWASVYSVNELSNSQVDEAIFALENLLKLEKNHLASYTLGTLYLIRKNNFDQFYKHIMISLKQDPYFNFDLWRLITLSRQAEVLANYEKTKEIRELLNSKKREIEPEEMAQWELKKDVTQYNFKNRDEIAAFLKKAVVLSPGNALNVHRFFEYAWGMNDVLEMFEYIVKLNPLSPTGDYLQYAKWITKYDPAKKKGIEKIFKDVSKNIGVSELDYIYKENAYEKEWILTDLEKMIKLVQAAGAKVVVQTYPPKRDDSVRLADDALRTWYKEKKNKDEIVFMDVTKMLEDKFAQKNGGEQYYATEFGKYDDHQNEFGNQIIARLMLDYVEK